MKIQSGTLENKYIYRGRAAGLAGLGFTQTEYVALQSLAKTATMAQLISPAFWAGHSEMADPQLWQQFMSFMYLKLPNSIRKQGEIIAAFKTGNPSAYAAMMSTPNPTQHGTGGSFIGDFTKLVTKGIPNLITHELAPVLVAAGGVAAAGALTAAPAASGAATLSPGLAPLSQAGLAPLSQAELSTITAANTAASIATPAVTSSTSLVQSLISGGQSAATSVVAADASHLVSNTISSALSPEQTPAGSLTTTTQAAPSASSVTGIMPLILAGIGALAFLK